MLNLVQRFYERGIIWIYRNGKNGRVYPSHALALLRGVGRWLRSHQSTEAESETGDGSKSPSKKEKMTPDEQSAQFMKTARELECDESGEAFERLMSSQALTHPKAPD